MQLGIRINYMLKYCYTILRFQIEFEYNLYGHRNYSKY